MRKIIILSMLSLDGVIQGPGAPKEDSSNGFKYGGWTASFFDTVFEKSMEQELKPADYLLGRKTFEIWEDYWPHHNDFWPGINAGMKYVLSKKRRETEWKNTTFVKNISDIKQLKKSEGPNLQVWGSSQLIQLLLKHDVVDELRLKIYPVTLGKGKKLFGNGVIPAAFKLIDCQGTPSGVILANYQRAGKIKTGTVGA